MNVSAGHSIFKGATWYKPVRICQTHYKKTKPKKQQQNSKSSKGAKSVTVVLRYRTIQMIIKWVPLPM